jgi:uncharacterized protein YggE
VSKPRITVEGTATRWAPADHVDVAFRVVRRAVDAREAVRMATDAYAALDAALGRHGAAIERRTTRSLAVTELSHWEPETGRQVHDGFEASRVETVRFAPVGGAGAVVHEVMATVPELLVQGPWFGLAASNPVHAAVRADAAAAARDSAAAYASGLGLELGPVRAAREPGTAGRDPMVPEARFAKMAAADAGGSEPAGAPLLELTAEDGEVAARIELVITLR